MVDSDNVHTDLSLDVFLKEEELPIHKARHEIKKCLDEHKFVVVVGDTGSGKTTQLPQYLLEWGKTPLAITQPRRVAATSVSARVASILNEELGGEIVGYKVRFDSKVKDNQTRLLFMTDGILLRECISDPYLYKYRTIMLDEAHERSVETDILFGLVKRAVAQRTDLRCIIASATLDTEHFSNYFNHCPIVRVPGRAYPVDIYHSKQVQTMTRSGPLSRGYVESCVEVAVQIHSTQPEGHILIFLTGQDEIERACRMLREKCQDDNSFLVLPLYGALSFEEARRVFTETDNNPFDMQNKRKIVFATNVAETSITVPGVRYVIDAGYVKLKGYEPRRGVASLSVVPISKVAAEQRAGRAGRTAPGQCYRLYSKACFDSMSPDTMPAIKRTSMASVVLALKSLGVSDILNFDFLDAPDQYQLACALIEIYALGGLRADGNLTPLGRAMSTLPLEPNLARSLVHAASFKEHPLALASVLAICACLSSEEIWITPSSHNANFGHNRHNQNNMSPLSHAELAASAHLAFRHERGDLFSLASVYQAFIRVPHSQSMAWCKRYYLRHRALRFARKAFEQLDSESKSLDITGEHLYDVPALQNSSSSQKQQQVQQENDDDLVTRSFCFGLCLNAAERGFHPEAFVLLQGPGLKLDAQLQADQSLLGDTAYQHDPPNVSLVRIADDTAAAFRRTPDAIVFHELKVGSSSRGAFARNLVVVSPSLLALARARLEQQFSLAALCNRRAPASPSAATTQEMKDKKRSHNQQQSSVYHHQAANASDLDAARQRFLARKKKK